MEYIPYILRGIPCQIEVTNFFEQKPHKGSPQTCWSDMDYHGYFECEWNVRDRKGYLAPWLENKITPAIEADIQATIYDYIKREEHKYDYL